MLREKILWLSAAMLMSCSVGFAQQPDFDHPNGSFNNPTGGFNSNVTLNNTNGGFNNSNGAVHSPNVAVNNPNVGAGNPNAALNVARQIESKLDQLWMSHDANGLLGLFDQNTVWITNGARSGLANEAQNYRQALSSLRNIRSSTVVNSAAVQNGYLVINFSGQRTYDFFVQSRGWIPNTDTIVGQDIWTTKGGQWKLVQNSSTVKSFNAGSSGGSSIVNPITFQAGIDAIRSAQRTTYYQMKASDALNKK